MTCPNEIKKPNKKITWKLKFSNFNPCNVANIFQIEIKLTKKKDDMIENIIRFLVFIDSLS